MIKKLNKTSIGKKYLFVMGFLVVLFWGGAYAVYRLNNSVTTLVHDSIEDKVIQTQYANATQVASALQDNITDLEEKLGLLATLPAVLEGDTEQCSAVLKNSFAVTKLPIANLSRLGQDGVFDCSVLDSAIGIKGFDYSYIVSLFGDPDHKPVFSRLLPLTNSEGQVGSAFALHVPIYKEGQFAGSLGGAFWMNDLLPPILDKVTLPSGSWVVVLDDNGDILWHPDQSLIGLNINGEVVTAALATNKNLPQLLQRATTEDAISDRYFLATGEEHLAYARRIEVGEGRHWSVVVTTPVDHVSNLLAATDKKSSNIEIVLLLLILASVPCIGWLMWYWERSLEREVVHTTQQLEQKNTELASAQLQLSNMVTELAQQNKEAEKRADELEHSKVAIMNVLEDVEEAKLKKEQLANDLLKFKLAVDNTSDMIVITDPQGLVLYGNKSVEKITGYTVEEATGKKAATLWKTPMPEVFYKELWSTIKEKKQVFTAQVKNKRKSGEIYDADISVAPVLDTKGEIVFFVGIERDITAAMQVDRAKTEFVSLASHQLRTPLSAINWYTEMLLSGDVGELNVEQKQYLGEIYSGSQRMVELVNALLNVSRLELGTFAVDPAEVVLPEIVTSVIKELQPQINKRQQLFTETSDPTLPVIQADPKLIRIVIQNLLSNSVKYTQEKGEISITLLNLPKGTALGKRVATEDSVGIEVKDNGMGIPVGQHGNIFDKLFRADNVKEADTEGTGLGLYIVKAIIEQAKGHVWFDSVEGKGATFFIILPLTGMKQKIGAKRLD